MRIRHISLVTLSAFLITMMPGAAQAQPIELTWDLKWINPPAYLTGLGEVSIIPNWRTTQGSVVPVLTNFSYDQKLWIDARNNSIYEVGPNYSLISSQPLVPTDQLWRAFALSDDERTLVLSLEEIVQGREFTSLYVRTRDENGLFGESRRIHRPADRFHGIFSVQISANGDTLAWTEMRAGGFAVMVMQNLHSRPIISQLMLVNNLSWPTLRLSADGQSIFVWVWDSGFDLQQGLDNVAMFSRFTDGEWSVADYVKVDGEVYNSAVEDVNSDGTFIQIGQKVAYRAGDEFRTLYDFEPTRYDKLGGAISEDGRSVVFLSADRDPLEDRDPKERSLLERTSIPERDLVLVSYDPDRAETVQTRIVDKGFMINYHYKKDGSRLVWTKQEEDPFRDIVSVINWPELEEN